MFYKIRNKGKYKVHIIPIRAEAYWDKIKIACEWNEALLINNIPVATIHGSASGWYVYTLQKIIPSGHDYKKKWVAMRAAEKLFNLELNWESRYVILNEEDTRKF